MFRKSAQANNKENIKAQNQRAFVRETTGDWIAALLNHLH